MPKSEMNFLRLMAVIGGTREDPRKQSEKQGKMKGVFPPAWPKRRERAVGGANGSGPRRPLRPGMALPATERMVPAIN
jgi:hypothetical protein